MTVYRVQDKAGWGPYYNDNPAIRRHKNMAKWPPPTHDCGRWPAGDELCGFTSMRALRAWFSSDCVNKLKADGFAVVRIADVEVTAVGGKQCLFIDRNEESWPVPYDFDDRQRMLWD